MLERDLNTLQEYLKTIFVINFITLAWFVFDSSTVEFVSLRNNVRCLSDLIVLDGEPWNKSWRLKHLSYCCEVLHLICFRDLWMYIYHKCYSYSLIITVLVPGPKTTYPHNFVALLPCVMLRFCKVLDVMWLPLTFCDVSST